MIEKRLQKGTADVLVKDLAFLLGLPITAPADATEMVSVPTAVVEDDSEDVVVVEDDSEDVVVVVEDIWNGSFSSNWIS